MKLITAGLIVMVSICNIALNMRVQKIAIIANQSNSINFVQILIAFIIGTASMISMFYVYKNPDINLTRGIAWMGAISIIGGSMYGYMIRKNSLDIEEYILIFCLILLFSYRIFIKKY